MYLYLAHVSHELLAGLVVVRHDREVDAVRVLLALHLPAELLHLVRDVQDLNRGVLCV
jgi:hypothetical protein